jgi:hypothetical protein
LRRRRDSALALVTLQLHNHKFFSVAVFPLGFAFSALPSRTSVEFSAFMYYRFPLFSTNLR